MFGALGSCGGFVPSDQQLRTPFLHWQSHSEYWTLCGLLYSGVDSFWSLFSKTQGHLDLDSILGKRGSLQLHFSHLLLMCSLRNMIWTFEASWWGGLQDQVRDWERRCHRRRRWLDQFVANQPISDYPLCFETVTRRWYVYHHSTFCSGLTHYWPVKQPNCLIPSRSPLLRGS